VGGSLYGKTLVKLFGSFNSSNLKTKLSNTYEVQIKIGGQPCTINQTLSTQTALFCYTPSKPISSKTSIFDIELTNDLQKALNKCGPTKDKQCQFEYSVTKTPFIEAIYPQHVFPGQNVTITGKFLTSQNGQIEYVRFEQIEGIQSGEKPAQFSCMKPHFIFIDGSFLDA
jgi:hypothetical protein